MKGLNKNVKIAKATIFFIFDVICLIILSSGILASPPSFFYLQRSYAETPLCIDYIALNTTIRLNCGSATLSDIYDYLKKYKLGKGGYDGVLEKEAANGIWLLRSNLVISNNSSLTINATDTSWLKIYSDGKQAYSIKAYGNMNIDSVKITSWDPEENDYRKEGIDIETGRKWPTP